MIEINQSYVSVNKIMQQRIMAVMKKKDLSKRKYLKERYI